MNDVDGTHVVILVTVTVVWIALWVLAVVSIIRTPGLSGFERGIWVTIAILFPLLGPLLWAVWGRTRTRRGPLAARDIRPTQ
ncbi:PLDc N-terminal domain-containing protein [Herbiconiux sp. VKM Ac-1786]|uniref:PLDc N-terminal domain-containing protein n=1 Tax=Herbiconiux sp. VKM Ac-1786 TaxID=2783824 RepID=UPI00188AD819|nr:PLDc N-terminal domain-containing protein [Herbiconiux sp. VKM Ac-1786]MBF4571895.1 PLDc N-terminal domain-containing protein [Herbiconiux sp. VKM Ac-1786]